MCLSDTQISRNGPSFRFSGTSSGVLYVHIIPLKKSGFGVYGVMEGKEWYTDFEYPKLKMKGRECGPGKGKGDSKGIGGWRARRCINHHG